MPDIKLALKPEEADHILGMIGMPQPSTTPSGTAVPDMAAPNPSAGPLGQLPPISAMGQPSRPPGPATQQYQQFEAKQAQPHLGQPGSTHPGVLGKIGHVAGEGGGLAASALVPHVAALIPDTPLGRIGTENRLRENAAGEQAGESDLAYKGAQTGEAQARTGLANTQADTSRDMASRVPVTLRNGETVYVPQKDSAKLIGEDETTQGKFDIERSKESAAQMLQSGRPVTMDQLAAKATQEGDRGTLSTIENFKKQIAAAGKPEPGNFMPVNDAQGNIVGWANPKSRDWVPVGAISGGAVGQAAGGGGVIPPKPTSTTLQMGQGAEAVSEQIPGVVKQVQDLAASLGPATGRWNQLLVNKGGTDFPQFAALDENLQLLASGIARAHFGARGAASATGDFKKYLTEAQTPQDLIARIQAADGWMQGYARHAGISPPNPSGGGQGGSSSGGMVTMKAPNGQTKQVPADQVEHFKSLGAIPQ